MISRDTYIQLTKFAIVGFLSFALDFLIYYTLSGPFGWPTIISRSISAVCSTVFNYYLNTTCTWGQSQKNRALFTKYMLLYVISGTTNVLFNELFLRILPDTEIIISLRNNAMNTINSLSGFKLHKFGAFVLATLIGMVVNFLGQKLWLFKEDK